MKERKNKKNVISLIIICIVLSIIIGLCIEEYKEIRIELKYNTQTLSIQNTNKDEVKENTKEYPKEEVIGTYKGYEVSSKLEIPKIELETYVLQKYSIDALKVSVNKFWGADANEIGNFCIAGHNFKKKNMFYRLKELQIGDSIFISDNKIGKVEYVIYDMYNVEPIDITCLSQKTNGKREVTLITCTNDSKKRIIIKAKEI